MKALLLIAHGSRRSPSNDEVGALAARLRDGTAEMNFDLVEHAFLEMAAPDIAQGGDKLIAAGADEIILLPYFLAAGAHVAADIPAEAARIQSRHPTVRITIAPHLGAADEMLSLLRDHLRRFVER
ncbi:MAG: sirohydrochlorin chelatase [bacterium]